MESRVFRLSGHSAFCNPPRRFLATRPVDGVHVAKSSAGESESKGNVLVVQTTTKELESISKNI